MNSASILLYALTSFIAGFVSSNFYRKINGNNWVWNIILTTSFFAGKHSKPFILTLYILYLISSSFLSDMEHRQFSRLVLSLNSGSPLHYHTPHHVDMVDRLVTYHIWHRTHPSLSPPTHSRVSPDRPGWDHGQECGWRLRSALSLQEHRPGNPPSPMVSPHHSTHGCWRVFTFQVFHIFTIS